MNWIDMLGVDSFLESDYEERQAPALDDFFDSEDDCGEDDEEYHDLGMTFNEDGTLTRDCECGWTAGPTKNLSDALAYGEAHQKEMGY